MNVRYIEYVLVTVVVVAPSALLPEALCDVGLILVILRVTVLSGRLARQFSIDRVAATLQRESTTLEILRCTVLSLVLALRVCAYLLNSY